MTETDPTTDRGVPTKCRSCERLMSTPLVCDFCHALNPAAAEVDYFTMLGLPRRFDLDVDELRRKYLALSRHAHPDYHTEEDADVQRLHLHVSANVNDAYRTLLDPARRAAYLLEQLGGASSADDKSVPDGFLGTMMMMQEELEEVKSDGNAAELKRIGDVLHTQHDGLLRRIAGLFAEIDDAVGCEAIRKDLLGKLRKQLNAVSYVKKLVSQV